MEFLKGKKTYFVAAGIGVLAAVHSLGYIDDAGFQALAAMLGAGGLATLRMGVAGDSTGEPK